MKKAYELSVLCDCEIALIIFTSNNKLYQYASSDMDKVLLKYTEYNDTVVSQTNKDIVEMLNKKENQGGGFDDDDDNCTLTPNTEANYRKIDQEYAKIMQQGGPKNVQYQTNPMTVSVPVNSQNFAQQMAAASGNPQQSSSVLLLQPPTAHNSTAPLTVSPNATSSGSKPSPSATVTRTSPAPPAPQSVSPVPTGVFSSKELNEQLAAGKRPNLRVIIPAKPNEENRNKSTALETPLVSIATPGNQGIPTLTTLGSGLLPSDLQINSADLAKLLDPMAFQNFPSAGAGPLTAAVQASGITLTPAALTPSGSGLHNLLIPASQAAALKLLTSSGVKAEPASPNDAVKASTSQPPEAHKRLISQRRLGEGDEPPEKQGRIMSDG